MTNDIKYVKIDRHAKSRGGFRVIQAIRKIEKRINEMNNENVERNSLSI